MRRDVQGLMGLLAERIWVRNDLEDGRVHRRTFYQNRENHPRPELWLPWVFSNLASAAARFPAAFPPK
jgi:hypothetical protein